MTIVVLIGIEKLDRGTDSETKGEIPAKEGMFVTNRTEGALGTKISQKEWRSTQGRERISLCFLLFVCCVVFR